MAKMYATCINNSHLGSCHLLEGRGGGWCKRGGVVIKLYVGRVTKNLSWALGRAIPLFVNIAVHLNKNKIINK